MPDKRLEKTRRAYSTDGMVFRSSADMEQFYTERDRFDQAERIRLLLIGEGAKKAFTRQREAK